MSTNHPASSKLPGAINIAFYDGHVETAKLERLWSRRLAEAAVKRRPGLAVLFATGYTRNAVVHNGTIDPDVELIMKPFSLDALAQKVARVLRGGKAAAL